MIKVFLVALMLILAGGKAWSAPQPAGANKADNAPQIGKVKKAKKKLTRADAYRLQKKAEQEAKRHENEARRREYELMIQSQRRGMLQRQQELDKKRQDEDKQ